MTLHLKHRLLLLLFMAALALPVWAVNYLTLTDSETTRFGDRIAVYCDTDTLAGPVRTNDLLSPCMSIRHVFTDLVLGDVFCYPDSACEFLVPPIPDAPPVHFPSTLTDLRRRAENQGRFYDYPNEEYDVLLRGGALDVYHHLRGQPIDSSSVFTLSLGSHTESVFFDGPVTIRGVLEGDVQIGSSHRVGISDDVRYVDADPLTGVTPLTSRNFLTLASENDVKVLNTAANGRENSGGLGRDQTDPALTDVVITAGIYALGGSFTFDQQNDPDSGYVCACQPDERGDIYLFGGVVQRHRGYTHRSTRTGTGYRTHLRYDRRWLAHDDDMGFPVWNPEREYTTDSLNFGSVQLDSVVWDTAHIYSPEPVYLGSIIAPAPYTTIRPSVTHGQEFWIPVRFAPTRVQSYNRSMTVIVGSRPVLVRLTGRGIDTTASGTNSSFILPPSSFTLSAAPNPFNSRTAFTVDLPHSGPVRLSVVDLLGRPVATLLDGMQSAGRHRVSFNAAGLPSGLYFARLETPSAIHTQKLLLVR